jgi:two-component system, chemotaxis family, CheB/CheR fusion protein
MYLNKEETKKNEDLFSNKFKIGNSVKFNSISEDSFPVSPYKELFQTDGQFRHGAKSLPVLMWMADVHMSYTFFNKSWIDFTGRNIEQEKNSGWMAGIHADDIAEYEQTYTSSFNARKSFYIEFRLRRFDGEYHWLANRGEPRYSADGKFEGYIGNCVEIFETKASALPPEQKISERTKALHDTISKLEQSNLELTQFAYVATHDLQEPLRKIKIFTERLLLKAAYKLNEDEISYVKKIKTSSNRMSDLIKDVLAYSILSKSSDPFPKTDLNAILQNVLLDFELLITQKKAVLNIDKLPSIDAIPLQMNQLFNNLISNSLKFTREGILPIITIRQTSLSKNEKLMFELNADNSYVRISFSDNGIGFNKEYSSKIFEIFQRLNGNDKFPGTGIGLALCKKIIHNHKGLIFAESSEGSGATFQIILPLTH